MATKILPAQDGSNINLECELCHKSYQRRDLLLRHRRRCQGPRKSVNRRKACEACVQSKTKCCYTQPTCTRCAIRGTLCNYARSSSPPTAGRPEPHAHIENDPDLSVQPSTSQTEAISSTLTGSFDLDLATWDFSISPFSMETFNVNLNDLGTNPITLSNLEKTPSMAQDNLDLMQSTQDAPAPAQLAPSSDLRDIAPPRTPNTSTSLDLVRAISKYPYLLMKGSFLSPLLHLSMYSLYNNIVPDMTFLPQTSMAICCGSGLDIPESRRFFKRALDAARQRLISSFPSLKCMQQWDALHAMIIYEMLDLREVIRDEPGWYHSPCPRGLRSPFLLKMTQSYLRSYPAIHDHDINAFADPESSPCLTATTPWARWRTTEAARRTIFCANLLNFHINRDPSTGEQLPYYESFDEDLVLHMPLPCSQAAWSARNEEDWHHAMSKDLAQNMDTVRPGEIYNETCLKDMLQRYTKEDVQSTIGDKIGFENSDELRNLIILSTVEQFGCISEA